jgi:feruloyl esterase
MPMLRAAFLAVTLAVFASFATSHLRATGAPGGPGNNVSCESLAALALPNAHITSAQTVAAGAFQPPAAPRGGGGGGRGAQLYAKLPTFCRVAATLTPSNDSDIKIEVWLPSPSSEGFGGWNGKFQAVGNGGWAGVISYAALAQAVAAGYAGASTDTGHVGNTAAFATGHPEKVIDMGYRAVHEMTVKAKSIVDSYYGTGPKLSFWNGCSQGGRQGITEAQRYPADFDAIVAGAPAVNWMALHGVRMAIHQKAHATEASAIAPDKYPAIHEAVLNACDALDGVKDGVIEDPTRCHFDPKVLQCQGADGPACLTPAQVETARALYAPLKNAKSGAAVFPALLLPGSEPSWATLVGPEPIGTALDAFKYVVFKDPNWDARRFNAETDIDAAIKMDAGVLHSGDTNLMPFFKRGGKLLMYHGWADPQVPALNSVDYFDGVVKTAGRAAVGKSIELYMVPGMAHCAGGPGTDTFDKMAALEQWVEHGAAPSQIVASHLTNGAVARTRPLCQYGRIAHYKGAGSTDDAASFECVAR